MNPARKKLTIKESIDWYSGCRSSFDSLTKIVCGMLEGLIKDAKIDYLSITGRTKTVESVSGKFKRKRYTDPKSEISDLSGIRVIAFIEADVQKITNLVRKSFNVHTDKSLDKTDELGTDRAGYRSIHLVCDLGGSRGQLPEYAPFKGMLFEVQVRTVLQHAWAEIEHDRNYKFSGVLPPNLERRLNLAAATLEMVDREFDSVAADIDSYGRKVVAEAKKGNLDFEINTKSLQEYLLLKKPFGAGYNLELGYATPAVISELNSFGISTLAELETILTHDYIEAVKKFGGVTTDAGAVRHAMMYSDIERYFKTAWENQWQGIDSASLNCLASKYGKEKVTSILKKSGVEHFDFDEGLGDSLSKDDC